MPPSYLDTYWGNVSDSPAQRPAVRRRPPPAPPPIDIDQQMRDSIRQKILYANVMGVPDPSLVNMRNLTRLGITSQPNKQGLPYGVSPDDLSDEEKQWMIDTATQAGARARQASPAIDAMRQGPQ